ncbi:MAG: histidine--tRNA ligase [bacterium]
MSSDSPVSFAPPRGMRDFYPEDMLLRNTIFDAWRSAARQFGFYQYDACVVESLELLKRKGGEEITGQLYTFKDKSDRDLALRAEMTPTLARMICARQGALPFPMKWFAIAQCFRYERMTQGRKREHYQWNMDIVGEPSVAAEAEILAAAAHALLLLGFDRSDVIIHVSNRALLSDLLAKLGVDPGFHPATFLVLDKRGKIGDDEVLKLLQEAGLDATSIAAVNSLAGITDMPGVLAALGGPTPAYTALADLFEMLHGHGIADMVKFDLSVVRGLGYYTGVVFEAFDSKRQFRAIFGGGRYDGLLSDIGGKPMTAVGLGFGDVVISDYLVAKGKHPSQSSDRDITLGYMEDTQRAPAVAIAQLLRKDGRCVDMALHSQKAKAFFSRAGQAGFKEAIYLGPDDILKGLARVKNMVDRTERELPIPK